MAGIVRSSGCNQVLKVKQKYLWYKSEGGAVASNTTNEDEYFEITA